MDSNVTKSRVHRFVEENFSEFSKKRRAGFVEALQGRFAGCRHQAMWVIVKHDKDGQDGFELFDAYAVDKEDAKAKLKEFRKTDGKGHRCVVQKMLRVESDGDVWHLT